jgi:hypothetical protein
MDNMDDVDKMDGMDREAKTKPKPGWFRAWV